MNPYVDQCTIFKAFFEQSGMVCAVFMDALQRLCGI
jgi:hypothetical protein